MVNEQKKRKDNDPVYTVLRKLSVIISNQLVKTGITPNQITVLNFIIFTPLIIFFLTRGTYFDNLIALILIFASIILDLCDGVVARMKSMCSKCGMWLDGSLDIIFYNLVSLSVIIGVFRNSGEAEWFIIGLIMIFGQTMASAMGFLYDRDFGFDAYSGSKEFNQKFSNLLKIYFFDSFLKNIIVPSKPIYIFFFTCRYLLALGIVFNALNLFLIIFALTINIRWISMWFLYFKFISGATTNLYTVRFLNELYNKKHNQQII